MVELEIEPKQSVFLIITVCFGGKRVSRQLEDKVKENYKVEKKKTELEN